MKNQIKILIVDDNKIRRKILADFLLRLNYEFNEASNGKEAIELFKKNQFDIIIMDLHMPVMDGIETTKYMRSQLPFPKNRVKIIANTAYNYKDFFANYYDAGFNDILPNPNTFDAVKNIIEYHITTATS